jgi:C1A family cysteine protease
MRSKLGASSTLSSSPFTKLLLTSILLSLLVLAPMHGERVAASPQEPAPTPVADGASYEPQDDGAASSDADPDKDTSPLDARSEPEGWTAGETSVSGLSAQERRALAGLPMEVLEWEEEQASQQAPKLFASSSYTYPPAWDWRNYGGMDWTTPVRHQGNCASCAAFATAAAIESRLEILENSPSLNPNLSEAQLFYCGCGACCSSGASPISLMEFARDTGIVDEGCFPYTAQNQGCSPCQGWQNRVTKIFDWVGVKGVEDMKQTLVDEGPFEAAMMVYSDFYDYTGGVYRHTYGSLEGGHAVTIVGYSDYGGYWIAKNSWGTGWGENGWFRIAYGECSIDNYAYVPIMPDPAYHVSTSASPSVGGMIAADPPDCTDSGCDSGTTVELTASPSDGYEFTTWSGDISGSDNPSSILVDADKEVTAHFTFRCDDCTPQAFVPCVVR